MTKRILFFGGPLAILALITAAGIIVLRENPVSLVLPKTTPQATSTPQFTAAHEEQKEGNHWFRREDEHKRIAPLLDSSARNGIWDTYVNEALGIYFMHPKEYCIGFFTKQKMNALGYYDDPSSPEYYIFVTDSREMEQYTVPTGVQKLSPCDAPFSPGPSHILDIEVYSNRDRKAVGEEPDSEFKIFMLPSSNIQGIKARRYLTGEGKPERGVPFYHIDFQKGGFVFKLFTVVDCTAEDGSCKPPRDEQFITAIDKLAQTIRFTR